MNSSIDPNNLAAFDLEIHKEIPWIIKFPDGTESKPYYDHDLALRDAAAVGPEARLIVDDFGKHRPLGITCARVSIGQDKRTFAADAPGKMSQEQALELLAFLQALHDDGNTLVTWNGLGFDFLTLAEESGDFDTCAQLALNHWDIMFNFFCEQGYTIGQDATARGMGLPGKPEAMDGAIAPVAWKDGRHEQVKSYVASDGDQLLQIAQMVLSRKSISWVAKSGKNAVRQITPLLNVQALHLPLPDTSWMDSPWPRSQFHAWTAPHLS